MRSIWKILLLLGVLIVSNGAIRYMPYPSRAIALQATYALLLEEPDNMIGVNPGFETGDATGWWSGLTISAGSAYSGTYKAGITIAGSGTPTYVSFLETNNFFNLIRGVKYKVIFAYKSATAAQFNLRITDENGLIGITSDNFTFAVAWKLAIFNFTAPNNFTNCNLTFDFAASAGYTAYFDYFYVVPEYVDFGLEDFSMDFLIQPFTSTGAKYLARKCADDLSRGWALTYSWTDYKYRLTIADGTNTATIASSAVTAVQNQTYHHVRLTVDRSGSASFYVDNVAAGSGSVAAVTDNISVVDPLYVGGFDGTTDLAQGYLDFIRFSRGTLPTAAEMTLDYARLAAGRKRNVLSTDVLFDFNDGLLDDSGVLLLASTPSTTPDYADGWPYCVGPLTYNFTQNYSYGHRQQYLAMDSIIRDFQTGAAYLYPGPRKREIILNFVAIQETQLSAFLAAYEGGQPLDLWLDAASREYVSCAFTAPPWWQSMPVPSPYYETELDLVEI